MRLRRGHSRRMTVKNATPEKVLAGCIAKFTPLLPECSHKLIIPEL
jgi:hypothetical protein